MVIEHTFISSKSPDEVMASAASFLAARGFVRIHGNATPGTLDMERGVKRAAKAKSVIDLPQRVRVTYDRGRVDVAGSIEPSMHWGGARLTKPDGIPARMEMHEDLLQAMMVGLERLLSYDGTGVADYADWDDVETAARDMADRRHRRNMRNVFIGVGILLVVFVAIWVMIIVNTR